MSLVLGMAVGTQRYELAIIGTIMLLLVVLYLSKTSFGTLGRYDGYLTVRVAASEGDGSASRALLDRFCRVVKQISTRQSGDEDSAEFVFQVGLRDRDRSGEFLRQLRAVEGVTHASLVLRNELTEV
jgi:uncharacterized membrane protein YhiD involved in acid resistance